MQKIKWYLIVFAVGFIIGAGVVLGFMFRPASVTITELRDESKLAAKQYRTKTTEYNNLLGEAGGRISQLAKDLGRAAETRREDLERIEYLEAEARSLAELIINVQESSGRSYEHNRGIRTEADSALGELREYRETLTESISNSREGTSTTED